ncbi:MAG: hypothetical protein KO464_02260 [Candidatus Methanofastidiosum sp.]|nr:hypothetical protein [Methanofastidiosum sp.]
MNLNEYYSGYRTKASDPFFNLAAMHTPSDYKTLLRYAKYFYATEPLVSDIVFKKAEYPITSLLIKTANSAVKAAYESVFEEMQLRENLVEIGINYYIFGVVFATLYEPFRRTYTCSVCGSVVEPEGNQNPADDMDKANWDIRSKSLYIYCPNCKVKQKANYSEEKITTSNDFRLHLWDPLYIEDEYNPLSERHTFVYTIPKKVLNDIRTKARFLKEVPKTFLEVALQDKAAVRFNEDKIIFLKRPSYADDLNGLGIPPVFHIANSLYHMGLLKKANDFIAADHLKPYRYFTPAMVQGSPYPPQMPAFPNMGNMASSFATQIQRWRNDPNEIAFFPIPLQQNSIGGDGRPLMVHQELQITENEIISGLQVPQEFVKGGLSWSGSSVSLRMLENHFINYRGFLSRVIKRVAKRISLTKDLPEVEVGLQEFKMADDAERKRYYMELNGRQKLSDETLMEELGLNPETEFNKMLKDAKRNAQLLAENTIWQQLAQLRAEATLQTEAMPSTIDISNKEIPGFLMEALMESTSPDDLLETPSMQEFLGWMQTLTPSDFKAALMTLKEQFPVVYSLLLGILPTPRQFEQLSPDVEEQKPEVPEEEKPAEPLPERRPPRRKTGQQI